MCSFRSSQDNINNFNEGTTEEKRLDKPIILNPDDVIYIPSYKELRVDKHLIPNDTLKCSELQNNIKSKMMVISFLEFCKEEFESEVLIPNQFWKKGFLEVSLVCNVIFKSNNYRNEDFITYQNVGSVNTLTHDTVISVTQDLLKKSSEDVLPSKTLTVGQLNNNIASKVWKSQADSDMPKLKNGFQASVLSQNQSWREGHIEIQIGCELVFKPETD